MKFRKKPVEFEAVRWSGSNLDTILEFVGSPVEHDCASRSLLIKTLEGTMKARIGDWIVKGVKGEFYPVKESIFRETYDEVRDA